MTRPLEGKKIAILVTDGFEQAELTEPRKALQDAGAKAQIVALHPGQVKAWETRDWGESFPVDVDLHAADAQAYDALLLPGGVMNPDHLRMNGAALRFVKAFFDADKPVATICHGPWTLIDAGVVKNRRLTSWPSLKTDLVNAGADWVDAEVVVDRRLVSSRKPDDLPAFNRRMVEVFGEAAA